MNEATLSSKSGQQAQNSNPAKTKRKRMSPILQLRDKNQRDADTSLLLNLTLDINDLRQQVRDCIMEKSIRETRSLVAREQFHARSLHSVNNFFHVFRHGHPGTFSATEEGFLMKFIHKNVGIGGGVNGRARFMEQWRRYKQLFNVRRVRIRSTNIISSDAGSCLIECVGEFDGQVTAAALQIVFPNSSRDDTLMNQVLGRRFVCPTKILISLDANGRLVQYDAFSNVFEAMSRLLDFDPVRILTLMADAAISDGSLLPSVDNCSPQTLNADERNDEESNSSSTNSSRNSIEFILS